MGFMVMVSIMVFVVVVLVIMVHSGIWLFLHVFSSSLDFGLDYGVL